MYVNFRMYGLGYLATNQGTWYVGAVVGGGGGGWRLVQPMPDCVYRLKSEGNGPLFNDK